MYFPQDGTVYLDPDPSLYGAIKPILNASEANRSVLRDLSARQDIAINAWLVLLHNSPLGLRHPEACVENAFGDRYVYSLCPSHPDVRDYAVALARDVSRHYDVSGLSLESPGYLPYVHGYHHEFALLRPNRWLDNLLGLCFAPHSIAGAEAAGIDARRLRAQVRADIEAYLASDLDFPDDMAEAFWLADVQTDGDLRRYLDWRCGAVTSLVAEIKAAVRPELRLSVIPSVARPTAGAWYEGTDLKPLAEAGVAIDACFYEPSTARVKADLFDVRRRIGAGAQLGGILRPAYPDLPDKGDFLAAVAALRAGGVEDLAFYNWGHLRQHNLAWIGEALSD